MICMLYTRTVKLNGTLYTVHVGYKVRYVHCTLTGFPSLGKFTILKQNKNESKQ